MGAKRKKTIPSTGSESETAGGADDEFIPNGSQRRLVTFFEDKMSAVVKDLQAQLAAKDASIDSLKTDIVNLNKIVMSLENKLEDTEAYERRDTVIVSGSELPLATEGEDSSKVVSKLIKDKINLAIKPSDISISHRLGKKPISQAPDRRSIIVKFCRRDIKRELISACKTVKPPNLYVNESLTRTRSTALFGLRHARRKFPEKIVSYGSYDGNVHAWVRPPNPSARNSKVIINTKDKFNDFCRNFLNCNPSDLVTNWPI